MLPWDSDADLLAQVLDLMFAGYERRAESQRLGRLARRHGLLRTVRIMRKFGRTAPSKRSTRRAPNPESVAKLLADAILAGAGRPDIDHQQMRRMLLRHGDLAVTQAAVTYLATDEALHVLLRTAGAVGPQPESRP
jgi:hypothetical protein